MAQEDNPDSDKPLVVLRGGSSLIDCKPVFTADSKYLLCGNGDSVKLLSVASGECVRELRGHHDTVTGLLFPTGNPYHLLTCSLDGKIIKWNYEEGTIIKQYNCAFSLCGIWNSNLAETFAGLRRLTQSHYELVTLKLPKNVTNKRIKAKTVVGSCNRQINHIAIGSKNKFIAAINDKTLQLFSFKKERTTKLQIDKEKFTCVSCHPTDESVATGCHSGKIYIWWSIFQEKVVRTVNHWHALPVLDVSFTTQGSYMLSGGHECVLVKWQYNSQHKDTLPRLGAPITAVTSSQDNTLYATCHADNVIQIIRNNFKVVQIFQGLTRNCLGQTDRRIPTGLLRDPRSQALVLNGRPGHLQFYSLNNDRMLYNLDIVGQNYISPADLDKPLVVTEVEKAEFSHDGKWLATVERRDDGVTTPEIRLKFWLYDDLSQGYKLNTSVDVPHQKKVVSLKFRQETANSDLMLVTTSEDEKFKLWQLIDDSDIYKKNQRWSCESVGYYQQLPAGDADFSEDGSLLAVAFDSHLTLWDPDTNALRFTLSHGTATGKIRHVMFGRGSCSHLLIVTTDTMLTVWNLLKCAAEWSRPLEVVTMAQDPTTELIAAFSKDQKLYIFRPKCSEMQHMQSIETKTHSKVVSAIFIPHLETPHEHTLSWQKHARLYFLNEAQSLLTIESQAELDKLMSSTVKNIAENLQQTAFSLLLTQQRKRLTDKDQDDRQLGNPGAQYLKEMLNTPAHVLPSVSSICMSFMDTLLIHKKSRSAQDDESDDEDEGKDAGRDSDMDSDMEVDAAAPADADDQSSTDTSSRLAQYDGLSLDRLQWLSEPS